MNIIEKLDKVEKILKHIPGRHPQQRHAGSSYGKAGAGAVSRVPNPQQLVGEFLTHLPRHLQSAEYDVDVEPKRARIVWSGDRQRDLMPGLTSMGYESTSSYSARQQRGQMGIPYKRGVKDYAYLDINYKGGKWTTSIDFTKYPMAGPE